MPVIRQKQQSFTNRIAVPRLDSGGTELWESISRNASSIAEIAFKKRDEAAVKDSKNVANQYSNEELTLLDPNTGEPKVLSDYDFNPRAEEAFSTIIKQRYVNTISNNIELRSKEFRLNSNSPAEYKSNMSHYLAELSNGAEGGFFKNHIESVGTQRLALTHLEFLATDKKEQQERQRVLFSQDINSSIEEYKTNLINNVPIEELTKAREKIFNNFQPALLSKTLTAPQIANYTKSIKIAEAVSSTSATYNSLSNTTKKLAYLEKMKVNPETIPIFNLLDAKSRATVFENLNGIRRVQEAVATNEVEIAVNQSENKLSVVTASINSNNFSNQTNNIYKRYRNTYSRIILHELNSQDGSSIVDQIRTLNLDENLTNDAKKKTINNFAQGVFEPLYQDLASLTSTNEEKNLITSILSRGSVLESDDVSENVDRVLNSIFDLEHVIKRQHLFPDEKIFNTLTEIYGKSLNKSELNLNSAEAAKELKIQNARNFDKKIIAKYDMGKNPAQVFQNYAELKIIGNDAERNQAESAITSSWLSLIGNMPTEQRDALLEHLKLGGQSDLILTPENELLIETIQTDFDLAETLTSSLETWQKNFKDTTKYKTGEAENAFNTELRLETLIKDNKESLTIYETLINNKDFKNIPLTEQDKFRNKAQDALQNTNVIRINELNLQDLNSVLAYHVLDEAGKKEARKALSPEALKVAVLHDTLLSTQYSGGTDSVSFNKSIKATIDSKITSMKDFIAKQKIIEKEKVISTNWQNGNLHINDSNRKLVNKFLKNQDYFGPDGLFSGEPNYNSEQQNLLLLNEIVPEEFISLAKDIATNSNIGDVGSSVSDLFYDNNGVKTPVNTNQFMKIIHFAQKAVEERRTGQWNMKHEDIVRLSEFSNLISDGNNRINSYEDAVNYFRAEELKPKITSEEINKVSDSINGLTTSSKTNKSNKTVGNDGEEIIIYPDSLAVLIAPKIYGKSKNETERITQHYAQYFTPEFPIFHGLVNTGNDSGAVTSNQHLSASLMEAAIDYNITITPKTTATFMGEVYSAHIDASETLNALSNDNNFKVIISGNTLANAVFPAEFADVVLDFAQMNSFANLHNPPSILGMVDYVVPNFLDGGFSGEKLSMWNDETTALLDMSASQETNLDGTLKIVTPSRFNLISGAVDIAIPDTVFGKKMPWYNEISKDRDLFMEYAFGGDDKLKEARRYLSGINNDVNDPQYQSLKKWLKKNHNFDLETMSVYMKKTDDGFIMFDSNDNIISKGEGENKKPINVLLPKDNEALLEQNRNEMESLAAAGLADREAELLYLSKEELLARQERITKGIEHNKILYDMNENDSFNKKLMRFIAKGRVGSLTNNLTEEKNMILDKKSIPIINWFKKNQNKVPFKNDTNVFNPLGDSKFRKLYNTPISNPFKNKTNVFE